MKSNVAEPGRRTPHPPGPARAGSAVTVALSVSAVSYALVQSMVNPGLEALRARVHTDQLGVSWVLTAFLLASAVLTPVLGRLGDRVGKRRVLIVVLLLLTAGSVVAALATRLPVLVVGRLLQGAGGATLPLAFGIVRDLLPTARVGSTVGLIAAVSSVGGAVGVLVTGPIIDGLGVPWLFWLPALANGLMALAVLTSVPGTRTTAAGGRMNWPAALLLALALVALLLPLSLGQEWGWGSARTLALLTTAVVAGAAWVTVETRSRYPLIDMRVFRLRPVWTANLASFLLGATLYSAFGFIPSFLQVPSTTGYGLGESITAAGLLFLPATATQFLSGLAAGPLARRVPTKTLLVGGSVPVVAGFLLLAAFHGGAWQVALATAVAGAGFGIGLSALSVVVVHAVPAEHTGAATGTNANIRTIGGAVGAAAVATILASGTSTGGHPAESGYTTVFVLLAATAAAGLLAGLLIPATHEPEPAGTPAPTAPALTTPESETTS